MSTPDKAKEEELDSEEEVEWESTDDDWQPDDYCEKASCFQEAIDFYEGIPYCKKHLLERKLKEQIV